MDSILTTNELISVIRLKGIGRKITQLHTHHTWKPVKASYTGANGLLLQQNMREYHVGTLGWEDIGQHLTLLPDGKWVTGRPFSKDPASVKGYNTGAFAVEIVGNFDIPGTGEENVMGYDTLEGEQLKSIIDFWAFMLNYCKLDATAIKFHRELVNEKTCPGTSIDKNTFIEPIIVEARLMNKFKDASKISKWAKEAVDYISDKGIMVGDGNGYFRPDEEITREEMAAVVYRILKKLGG